MRLLLASAFLWQIALSDRRILKNYESKLNAREGEVVGGMVKRYRCIEEFVPIEEARDYDRQLAARRRKQSPDGIKPKKNSLDIKEEEVETKLKVRTPDEKSSDEEIEQMLHEDQTTTTQESPIRPQIRRAPQNFDMFDHEKSRGEKVPISQLSPERQNQGTAPGQPKQRPRQYLFYDFDDEDAEYADEEQYYEVRPRARFGRRRHVAHMRRNPYFYSQRFPYRAQMKGSPRFPAAVPLVQQQYAQMVPSQPYFVQRRQPIVTNLQPIPVVQAQPQEYFVRQSMATLAPPVVMEPAERVDPAMSSERHPQRPLHRKLKLNSLPRTPLSPLPLAPTPPLPTASASYSFAKGQLEESTPENCKKMMSLATQFGIHDVQTWARSNCGTLQMFVPPGVTCPQLWHFIDSCHKRRFL